MSDNSKTRQRRLNTRQLKKLHLGEFQELGFGFTAQLVAGVTSEVAEQLLDAMVAWAESHQLLLGGGVGLQDASGYITAESGSVAAELPAEFQAWLQSQATVAKAECEALSDVWYS